MLSMFAMKIVVLLGPLGYKTSPPLDLIFSDVRGPAPIFSSDSFCYFC